MWHNIWDNSNVCSICHNLPDIHSQNVPDIDSQNVPDIASHNVPDIHSQNVHDLELHLLNGPRSNISKPIVRPDATSYVLAISLLRHKEAEILAVYIQEAGVNFVVVIIYRPGSRPADSTFFDEFAAVIERVAALLASVVIVGDVNIHLDDPSLPTSINFNIIISWCDLKQHVTGLTHEAGHTFDVVVTNNTFDIKITVNQPIFSDHSLISAELFLHDASQPEVNTVQAETRRNWKMLDCDAFRRDILSSDIITKPTDNCDIFCEVYDRCLPELVGKHVPIETRVVRHPRSRSAPWYNYECRLVKSTTRRLEKIYRTTHTATAYRQWRHQSTVQRTVFQRAHADYWNAVVQNARTRAACGEKLAHFFNLWPFQSASIQLRRLLLSSATRWRAREKQLWMLRSRRSITE